MANDVAIEIEQMLEEAWNKFKAYYDKKAPEYSEKWNGQRGNPQEDHWICWDEHDLCFQVGTIFYNKLNKRKEENKDFSDIEMHFEKKLDTNNFGSYNTFKDKLDKLILKEFGMKKGPKIDLIIAHESSDEPFLLCAEVKCFRTSVSYDEVNKDIEKLRIIKREKIADEAVFMVFDDYYHCRSRNKEIPKKIKDKLEEVKRDKEILVLDGDSKAKLRQY